MWQKENHITQVVGSHVDDFLFRGTLKFLGNITGSIKQKFKISAETCCSYKYLGLKVTQNKDGIWV